MKTKKTKNLLVMPQMPIVQDIVRQSCIYDCEQVRHFANTSFRKMTPNPIRSGGVGFHHVFEIS